MKLITVLLSFATGCLVLIGSSAVERHRFQTLTVQAGKPRIGFSWDPGAYEPGERLEVFYTPSLTSVWKLVHTEVVRKGVNEVGYEFKDSRPDAGGGFFTVRRFVDSDRDGTSDAQEELEYHSDPGCLDSDQDTIPDAYEIAHGMNPADPDTDHDGVTDEFEVRFGSNPLVGDTDGDGVADYDEWFYYHSDMNSRDTDNDGVEDLDEINNGLDPTKKNSVDPRFSDLIMLPFRGWNPFACPEGSADPAWKHVFYSDSPEGSIVLPESTAEHAVLKIIVSGSGGGMVRIGEKDYRVFGEEGSESETVLYLPRRRGTASIIRVDVPDTLEVKFASDDFMIGEMPRMADDNGFLVEIGWLGFPPTSVKVPCIHSLSEQTVELSYEPGVWGEEITCTWGLSGDLEIVNLPPHRARVSGMIKRGSLEKLRYRLSHPQYLEGECEFVQPVNYCLEEEEEPEEEEDEDSGEGSHPVEGSVWRSDDDPSGTNGSNREESEAQEEDETMESLMKLPKRQDLLKLREDARCDKIDLKVPEVSEWCCNCPEHQAHCVDLRTPSPKVSVRTGNGELFEKTYEDQTVFVYGNQPSDSVGDAKIQFNFDKTILERREYTVLGLEMSSTVMEMGREFGWRYEIGLPVSVDELFRASHGAVPVEKMPPGVDLSLVCNVGLPRGRMKLEFVDPKGHFQLWRLRDVERGWECFLDTEFRPSVEMSIADWRSSMDFVKTGESTFRVRASAPGSVVLKWSYACSSGGMAVWDETHLTISGLAPRLVFDQDRNGRIEPMDVAIAAEGRLFRFWVNDDADDKVIEEGLVDLSGTKANSADSHVNGLRDVVDFTPVCVDLTEAYPELCPSSVRNSIVWKIVSDCVNVVQTSLRREEAGSFQTQSSGAIFGMNLDCDLESAKVESAAQSYVLNPRLTRAASEQGGYGVLLMEGCQPGKELRLEGWLEGGGFGFKLMECRANILVTNVDQMYRWIDIREAADHSLPIQDSGVPVNWSRPDYSGADERSFVFVHGFNVNAREARAWASEMYKRLWQAGFDGQFVAVDWTGDSSQFHSILLDDNYAPDYYLNVRNAFRAASVLPQALRNVSGQKTILAHSLGNMLVSSAAADYGLEYDRYYMLNAAVPMEAYDATAYAEAMVDTEWNQVPKMFWASDWCQLFGWEDFRNSLNWKGRFAGLRNVVNVYSQTEDVLGNPQAGQLTYVGGAWKIQELSKGTTTWYDLNALSLEGLDVVCEGGWGINRQYATNPLWYIYQYGFTSRVLSEFTREDAIMSPLFTPFRERSAQMQSLERFPISQGEDLESLRARFLGDAIPATSFAQGANAASPKLGWTNLSLPELADHLEAWPRGAPKNGVCEWHHSDLKNLPYFYVHKIFEKIVKGE